MDALQYLDEFMRLLRRAGLPGSYIRSATAELRDHLKDAEARRGAAALAALGDCRLLAESYVEGYRLSSLAGRFPFATLFIGGAIVAAACPLLGMAAWYGLCWATAPRAGQGVVAVAGSPPILHVGGWSRVQIVNVLAVALSLPVMLRAARAAGRGWAGVGLALFWPCLYAPCTPISLTVPVGAPQARTFVFTYGLAWGEIVLPPLMALVLLLRLGLFASRRWSAPRPTT